MSGMESSPAPDAEATPRPSRRKSSRVAKPPAFLSPSAATSRAKRKRSPVTNDDEDEALDGASPDEDEDDEEDSSEGEPDEEELREARRKTKGKAVTRGKPTAKRVRTNGTAISLPLRPAAPRAKKNAVAKGQVLVDTDAAEIGGLYGEFLS